MDELPNETRALRDEELTEKRGAYRLRKWYCDFLTPGLDYSFVYFADVYLLGMTFRSLTIHLARSGKGVPLTISVPVGHVEEKSDAGRRRTFTFAGGQIVISDAECAVDATGSGYTVHLRYTATTGMRGQPVIIRNAGRKRILWKPVHVKSCVTGSVVVGNEAIDVEGGNGYVDYLESTFLPPIVPVRTLYWGRLHHPDLDLVYMRAAGVQGVTAWSRMSIHAGEAVTEWEDIGIANLAKPGDTASGSGIAGGYDIHASNDSHRVHVTVRHSATIQQSSFIDHQEVKSALVRYILKKLTRDPRSTKWLSHADVVLEDPDLTRRFNDVPLIDEFALL